MDVVRKKFRVASVKDFSAGDGRIVKAGNSEVALFRVGDKFYALNNSCPHRGAPLGEGALDGKILTCPWHGWQFDVTTGALAMNPAEKMQTYSVSVEGDHVYVEI